MASLISTLFVSTLHLTVVGADRPVTHFPGTAVEEALRDTVCRPTGPVVDGPLPNRLADILFGGWRERPKGWEPSSENYDSVVCTGARNVKRRRELSVVSMSGPLKLPAAGDDGDPDLAELLWMVRLSELREQVRRIYPPGVDLTVVMEDWGKLIMGAPFPDLSARISNYLAHVRRLGQIVCPDVKFVGESELFRDRRVPQALAEHAGVASGQSVDWEIFLRLSQRFGAMFLTYLEETEQRDLVPKAGHVSAAHDSLESLASLRSAGFQGCVPLEQRAYYAVRASNSLRRDLDPDEARRSVATYLGVVLARGRLQLISPAASDEQGEIPVLKLSFVQTAPGSPASLVRNRAERVACLRHSRRCGSKVAPWRGTGLVKIDGDGLIRPTIVCSSDLPQLNLVEERALRVSSERGEIDLRLPLATTAKA